MTCPVYKTHCSEHDFVHGAEAEELRKGIEDLLDDASNDASDFHSGLRRLLDRVDARDSLAFLESNDEAEPVEPNEQDEDVPPKVENYRKSAERYGKASQGTTTLLNPGSNLFDRSLAVGLAMAKLKIAMRKFHYATCPGYEGGDCNGRCSR